MDCKIIYKLLLIVIFFSSTHSHAVEFKGKFIQGHFIIGKTEPGSKILIDKKKIDVILVPHGSISIPSDEFSEFVLPICARGLIYSKIANYSVAQSKISYEAIKYYDDKLKILKSKSLLFGKNILK